MSLEDPKPATPSLSRPAASEPGSRLQSTRASRRDLLAGTLGLALGVAMADSVGHASSHGNHGGSEGHDHHAHHHGDHEKSETRQHAELVQTARECLATGEDCLAHCFEQFAAGDSSLSDCAASVDLMMKAVSTLERFAARDARHLNKVAELCVAVCDDCEETCKKHAGHHETCKLCAEACAKCAKACRDHLAKAS